jgi:hypothetical protein
MKKHLLLFLIIGGIIATSCNKILNPTSPNEVDPNTIFTSLQGLEEARVGMYATLETKDYYGGVFPLLVECYTDNGTCGGYNTIDLNDITDRAVQTTNLYIDGIYTGIYNSIYTANTIIQNANKVPGAAANATTVNNTIGEAYFVRGLAEFDLLRLFGEHWNLGSAYGISIDTVNINPTVPIARSTVAASYAQVISDLNQAANLINSYQGNMYASVSAANALLARVYLYKGDKTNAAAMATAVVNDNNFALYNANTFTSIYTQKSTSESVLELVFDPENQSFYNALTYVRADATNSDVDFIASANLDTLFMNRPSDLRSQLVDYSPNDNDISILPNGRTQKYRGETTKDNSAYAIRLAEMYLIRAEALGRTAGGINDLNTLRSNRGMANLASTDVPDDITFLNTVLDERRAELNFEGHRLFDLARTGNVANILGSGVQPIMPIPNREITAGNGVVVQNPGY